MLTCKSRYLFATAICVAVCLPCCSRSPAIPATQATRPAPSGEHSTRCPDFRQRPPGPPPSFERDRRRLAAQFDADRDGRLSRDERTLAQKFLADEKANGTQSKFRMGPPPGGGHGPFANRKAPVDGPQVDPKDSAIAKTAPLYDSATLRTLFLDFEDSDWETQLSDFFDTDIEVPATIRVDSQVLRDVGMRFRGMSSYMMIPAGYKRSFNVSIDAVHKDQSWLGARTLNLLNSNEDPTYLRAVIYLDIARHYLPAPKANHVRLVINGRSWGIYVNVEQFNADFANEWFGSRKGARFKVPGSPMGRGGLEYLGEDKSPYERIYRLKSKDSPRVWADLIRLCKTLNQTSVEQLEVALQPMLDIDGVLKFLALENVFINDDGYFTRASDYDLYQDENGRFHVIPYDTNETFSAPEHGPGQADTQGVRLDPLVGLDDATKPLRSRLLKVPALRQRYLQIIRDITTTWLDWNVLGPMIESYRSRIAEHVKADTRKLDSFEDFEKGIVSNTEQPGPCGTEQRIGLKPFVEQRRAYLLSYLAKPTEAATDHSTRSHVPSLQRSRSNR